MAGLSHMIARSTASGWTLCVIALAGLFGIWRLHVLAKPKMAEIAQDREEKLRKEMRTDIDALKTSRAVLDEKLNEALDRLFDAEAQIASQTVQIGQQRFVLNLVITELEVVSPGNRIAAQARTMLDAAASSPGVRPRTNANDDPDADLIADLDGKDM